MQPRRAIGIDIGGTKIAVAAVDASGRIAARTVLATEAELGFERAIDRMAEASERMFHEAEWPWTEACGLGIGCTGPVSVERGVINNPYTLPGWHECPIVAALGTRLNRDVLLENDADAAALGECFAGSARGARRVVMLTFGTGVGGGVTIDGVVYRGALGEHPELGHIPAVLANGNDCYCGARGCLESVASGTAIAAAGGRHGLGSSEAVFSAAAAGNAAAIAILSGVRESLAIATWTILHTFMPDLLVLGGGVMDSHFPIFAPTLEQSIGRCTMVPKNAVRVVRAALGNDAGIVGAASLVLRDH